MAEMVNRDGQMLELLFKDFFIYTVSFASLAQNANSTQTITIQADSDFRWEKAAFWGDDTTTVKYDQSTRLIPNMTVLITDTGSGRQLMNSAVKLSTLFGEGDLPFILPQPKIFRARSAISIQLTNTENAAATENVSLSFIGSKLFYKGGV